MGVAEASGKFSREGGICGIDTPWRELYETLRNSICQGVGVRSVGGGTPRETCDLYFDLYMYALLVAFLTVTNRATPRFDLCRFMGIRAPGRFSCRAYVHRVARMFQVAHPVD